MKKYCIDLFSWPSPKCPPINNNSRWCYLSQSHTLLNSYKRVWKILNYCMYIFVYLQRECDTILLKRRIYFIWISNPRDWFRIKRNCISFCFNPFDWSKVFLMTSIARIMPSLQQLFLWFQKYHRFRFCEFKANSASQFFQSLQSHCLFLFFRPICSLLY